MSADAFLTSDLLGVASFFFSPADCQRCHMTVVLHLVFMRVVEDAPFVISESQHPGFFTTGIMSLTSALSFGDLSTARSSKRLPSCMLVLSLLLGF
jgi:hypothetical protein